jgi:hypothetical protein
MAVSHPSRRSSTDEGPQPAGRDPRHAALVTAATAAILGCENLHWFSPAAPLVVVSADDRPKLLEDLGQACSASDPDAAVICDGPTLGAELAACEELERTRRLREGLLARRLVIVCRVDQIGSLDRQVAAARLLDAAAAAGTFVAVSLAEPPRRAGLAEALVSRLEAGLVVAALPVPACLAAGEPVWSVPRVIRGTAKHHGLAADRLTGHGRQRSVVAARCLAMYLARRLTGLSLEAIGAAFGGREHTTVMRGVRGVESRIAADAAFSNDVEQLVKSLRSRTTGRRSRHDTRRA